MINFLRNIKPINLRFYTDNPNVYELLKPDKSSRFIPSWLSSLETVDRKPTVKNCYGLRESYRDGFILPLWSDINIHTYLDATGAFDLSLEFADKTHSCVFDSGSTVMHPKQQTLIKLISPWRIECDEDITFSVYENLFSKPNRGVHFVSGALNFKYQNSCHFFFYIQNVPDVKVQLDAGDTPMFFRQNSQRSLKIECFYDPEKTSYLINKNTNRPFFNTAMYKRKRLNA